jgi:hypothetical protein
MKAEKCFRKIPPRDVVDLVLKCFRFTGLTDSRWFTKEELPLTNLDDWLPILEPYYLPCKAKRFLEGEMTPARLITIFRHILSAYNAELRTCERVVAGKKRTLYSIRAPSTFTPTNFSITFD